MVSVIISVCTSYCSGLYSRLSVINKVRQVRERRNRLAANYDIPPPTVTYILLMSILHCKLSKVPISLCNRMVIEKEIDMVATGHHVTPPPSVERQLAVLELTSVLSSETKYVVYAQ